MNSKALLLVVVTALALGAWLTRYEVIGTGSEPVVYRLDRWTGSMTLVGPVSMRKLDYEKAEPAQAEGWWSKDPLAK